MSAAGKAKGSRFENMLEQTCNELGVKARRLPRAGVKDIGDVAIELNDSAVIVCEAKAEKEIRLSQYLSEASVEADHYEEKYKVVAYPMAVVKRRGKGIGQAYVVWELDEFINFLKTRGQA